MKIGLLNIALELYKRGYFKEVKNIMEFGTKEMRVSFSQLEYAFKQTEIKFNKKNFQILKKFPKGRRISTKFFWHELGIKNYFCSDINKKSKINIDLNYPIKDKKLLNQFDLVTDHGNNEHVFNVGEAYKSMYNLTKKGGLLWVYQLVNNTNGFFNFDISFFEGFAAANNLSIVHACYLIHTNDYDQFIIPADKSLLKTINLDVADYISISYVFKKNSNKKFEYYYQYNYNKRSSPFKVVFLNNSVSPEKFYIPTRKIPELIKLAKKGDKDAISWVRALGHRL